MSSASSATLLSIAFYSLCSASMLLVNKVTVSLIPFPSFVTVSQLVVCAAFVSVLKVLRLPRWPVDDFEWAKVKPYLLYCCTFALGCYANMRALRGSNVETVRPVCNLLFSSAWMRIEKTEKKNFVLVFFPFLSFPFLSFPFLSFPPPSSLLN